MKIVHVCLSNWYIEGFGYQEDELVRAHARAGHDVSVIASTEIRDARNMIQYLAAGEYVTKLGVPVFRLAYRRWLPRKLAAKIRAHPKVYELLENLKPNVIMFHGISGWELRTVAHYASRNPDVLFYADNHADLTNSARNFLSRKILHEIFYRKIVRRSLGSINKVLCVSMGSMQFARDVYGVPAEQTEFYPLGGWLFDEDTYEIRRARGRANLAVSDDEIILVQIGKQTSRKKLIETLEALSRVTSSKLRLFVAGTLGEDIRADAVRLIQQDRRVEYLGWLDQDALDDLFCAADVYVQPGTQSVNMQRSLCSRCAIIIDDIEGHQPYHNGNGWLTNKETTLEMIFGEIEATDIDKMCNISWKIAQEMLDYRKLALRVLHR